MSSNLLEGLNEDQKKPVLDHEGPCFILAGPGAGKTKTIVARTNYMIKKMNKDPKKILMFTFTNKAAKEIQERVVKTVGDKGKLLTVGTYHSVCSRILRKYAEAIGFTRKFTIFDTDDSIGVLKKLIKGHYEIEPKLALSRISDWKNKMIGPASAMQNSPYKEYAELYNKYQDELKKQNAMDFDDLIYLTIILLERNPEILKAVNAKYQYIIADEFHDSCKRDIRFIELLAGKLKNVCMILDDEQSIYGFRGADIESVLNVYKIFPGMKTFILRRNYRSTKSILSAARTLIKNNSNQLEKDIFTENPQGDPVIIYSEDNADYEALRVSKIVQFLKTKLKIEYKDIAVLYRMSYLSRVIEDKLLKANIPYRIVGGTPFYARKEVKDILCYIRFAYNPNDFEALSRIINAPKRGIGEANFQKIYEYARFHYSQPIDGFTACKEIKLKGKAGPGLAEFNRIMDILVDMISECKVNEFINKVMDETNYVNYLVETEDASKMEERLGNIKELLDLSNGYEDIEEFMQNTALNSQINNEDETNENKVCLQTMHSAKGLEYRAVIIIGANEGVNPHYKAAEVKEIDEERRLFYVAMTRAMEYLFIIRPKLVMQQGRYSLAKPSRFLKEIDKQYIKIL